MMSQTHLGMSSGTPAKMPFASRSACGDVLAEPRTAGPTPLQTAIAERRTAIVSGTIVGHFAHWQYLTRIRGINVNAPSNRPFLAAAGLGWGLVYLGVLSTITIAQRDISRHADRLLQA